MPKNWGENSKAAEAKQRKDAAKREEAERKQKEKEDKLWEDNDKHAQRKMERKEEKDKKHLEKLQRKQESSKLLEEEMSKLKSAKPERVEKVSHFDLHTMKEREAAEKEAAEQEKLMAKKNISVVKEEHLLENVNRLQIEGEVARNVEEAIQVLGTGKAEDVDLHPEKRMRAAYLDFEEENLERLKKENPNMRLSQIKQLLKKEWQKSPKNPFNKIFTSTN